MTATNHAVTGAVLGLALANPAVALPVAFFSHYVLDALPHYGNDKPGYLTSNTFRNYLRIDALLCVLLVIVLAILQPQHWLLACICAFVATSPDLLWINKYLKARSGKPWEASSYSRWAIKIQWFEKPQGAFVEFAWFSLAIALLLGFL